MEYWKPFGLFTFLDPSLLTATRIEVLTWAWRASLVFTIIGFLTPIFSLISFLLGYFLIGASLQFGHIHHDSGIIIIASLLFVFCRSNACYSVDQAFGLDKFTTIGTSKVWPIRFIQFNFILTYFNAFLSKCFESGFRWATDGGPAKFLVFESYIYSSGVEPSALAEILVHFPEINIFMGCLVFLAEGLIIFTLWSSTLKWITFGTLISFHIFTALIVGWTFPSFLIMFFFLIIPLNERRSRRETLKDPSLNRRRNQILNQN